MSTGSPIATVREAVLKIGTGRVLAYALSGPLSQRLQRPIGGYGLGQGVLWRHLVASALAVELLDGVARVRVPGEAFAAALLHDLGQVVLSQFLDPKLLHLIALAREQGMSSRQAELEILGLHQGEVGALVAQEWQLPDRIVRAIAFAGSTEGGEDVLYDFVHLGHVFAGRIGEYPAMPDGDLVGRARGVHPRRPRSRCGRGAAGEDRGPAGRGPPPLRLVAALRLPARRVRRSDPA